MDHRPLDDELFPAVQEHDAGVIARAPFDEGALTGSITPSTGFAEGDADRVERLHAHRRMRDVER
jgi:aryl-alcohol dehydrogenase-like predicted oxidoreductase